MRERLLPLLTFSAALLSGSALADDTVTVVRHGLSCASADALAKLTLPDGSSRVDGAFATRDAMRTAVDGGCTRLRVGQTLTAASIRHRTTIVMADAGDGKGLRAFYLPNIDVTINRSAAPAASAAVAADALPTGLNTGATAATAPAPAEASNGKVPAAMAPLAVAPAPATASATQPQPGATSTEPAGEIVSPPKKMAFDGIRLGDSYDEVHARLHPDHFIEHVPLNDPDIRVIVAQKLGAKFDEMLVVQFDDAKVVSIERRRAYGPESTLPSDPIAQPELAFFGPLASGEHRTTGIFGWNYDTTGQLELHWRRDCSLLGGANVNLPSTGAADTPDASDVDLQTVGAADCHTTAMADVAGDGYGHVNWDNLTVRDMDAIYRYAIAHNGQKNDDSPSKPLTEADIDERPSNVLPTATKSYSAGNVTLGEDVDKAKSDLAGNYSRFDGTSTYLGEQVFIFTRKDGEDRIVVDGMNGKVASITHDQRFENGKQPLYSAVFALATTHFGPADATDQAQDGQAYWSMGLNGQFLSPTECTMPQATMYMPGGLQISSENPPMTMAAHAFWNSRPGYRFDFGLIPFKDGSDPKLLAGLRTELVDMAAITAFKDQLAKATAAAQATKEKAAAANATGL